MSDLLMQDAREAWYSDIDNNDVFRCEMTIKFCQEHRAAFMDYIVIHFPEYQEPKVKDEALLKWVVIRRYPLCELFVLDNTIIWDAFIEAEFIRQRTR